jgi:hypothetical protein
VKSQTIAFEPFGTLDGVLAGAPIKIMPIGTFYRGKRRIDIAAADLQQIAANLKAGLPRFRVPINENHSGIGKIGTVYDVAFDPQGADGPGLYATKYDLTAAGRKLLQEKRFDAVSPEMIWTKNDAKYQDPQTGKEHDNVIVGLALTERPFFGHDNVALFSEEADMADTPEVKKPGKFQRFKDLMGQMLKMLDEEEQAEGEPEAPVAAAQMNVAELIKLDGFKAYDAAAREAMAKSGEALPDGSYPIKDGTDLANAIKSIGHGNAPAAKIKAHIVKRAKALGLTDKLPPEWAGSTKEKSHDHQTQEAETMGNTQTPATETFMAEEFAALKAKAAQVDALKAQADTFAAQLTATQTALANTQRERDLDRMVQHADQFLAIPGTPAEIGEKLLALQEKDPALFTYFDGLLGTLDKQLAQSELFAQHTSAQPEGDGADSFEGLAEQILVKDFKGDKAHYVEAMKAAETQRPDLAKAYYRQGRGG